MLIFLRRVLRRAPLLALILFIWLVLTVLSLVGRGRAYKNYSTEHGRLPGLSIVMRGIHDHVYPWSEGPDDKTQKDGKDKKEDPASSGKEQDTEAADAADQDSKDQGGDAPVLEKVLQHPGPALVPGQHHHPVVLLQI